MLRRVTFYDYEVPSPPPPHRTRAERTTIQRVERDFNVLFVSADRTRLNKYLTPPQVFQREDTSGAVVVVGTTCFLYVDPAGGADAALEALLALRGHRHFVDERVLRVPLANRVNEHQKSNAWIAKQINDRFIPSVDFDEAMYFA